MVSGFQLYFFMKDKKRISWPLLLLAVLVVLPGIIIELHQGFLKPKNRQTNYDVLMEN